MNEKAIEISGNEKAIEISGNDKAIDIPGRDQAIEGSNVSPVGPLRRAFFLRRSAQETLEVAQGSGPTFGTRTARDRAREVDRFGGRANVARSLREWMEGGTQRVIKE